MKFLIARRAPEIPLWMYYIRCGVEIVCSMVNIVLLPFGRVCNLNTIWQGAMLRSIHHERKKKGSRDEMPKLWSHNYGSGTRDE